MKKTTAVISLILAIATTFCACGKTDNYPATVSGTGKKAASSVEAQADTRATDPLTGVANLESSAAGKRPVAIMVNNLSQAQSVQTGLNSASVIFECMVEGGITRLMAVYSDISSAPQIGTVRSARYTYVQLAKSLDAVYVHCGMDDLFTRPYVNSLDFDYLDLGSNSSCGFRSSNGLSYEHTLYTSGEKLTETVNSEFRSEIKESCNTPLFSFSNTSAPAPAGEGTAQKASVAMSGASKSVFSYDSEKALYNRLPGGNANKDYLTGEQTSVTNVFMLVAPVSYFSDNYHVKTNLSGGSGYYISAGGYSEITWKKGDASDRLKLYDANGNDLTVNAGRSWICFVPQTQKSTISFE